MYCATRVLHGMAHEGLAPAIFRRVTKNGIPYVGLTATMVISLLAFLQISNKTATYFTWFLSFLRLTQTIVYCLCCVVFLCWRRALKAQDIDLKYLPLVSRYQPYLAIYGIVSCMIVIIFGGFQVFLKGRWNAITFVFSYASILFFILLFLSWKIWKKTKFVPPEDADIVSGKDAVDYHEKMFIEKPASNFVSAALNKIF